jgi:hypothetical protein
VVRCQVSKAKEWELYVRRQSNKHLCDDSKKIGRDEKTTVSEVLLGHPRTN